MISTIELDQKVINAGRCVNCGACQGMCPYWHSHQGKTYKCFDCDREDGRCLRFCPRMETDLPALRERFFPDSPVLPELGPVLGLYMTRAADPAIRQGSQHGGTVTALVELALRAGLMDAAVMTRSEGGLNPRGVLATSPEEARACRGSSFQIPAALRVLNEALVQDEYKRIGVVGTPCKTLAVYKMKAQPFAENHHNAQNIGLVIGLFCGWGLDWKGTAALVDRHLDRDGLRHMDIPPSKYHCLELNQELRVDLDEVYPLVRESCQYCDDMTAQFSDLAVGGARSPRGWEVDQGWNQLIVRSQQGLELLELAREQQALEVEPAPEGNLDRLRAAAMSKKNKAKTG